MRSFKKIITIILTLSFIITAVTGFLSMIMHSSIIFDLHFIFGILFSVLSVMHLIFNIKSLLRSIKTIKNKIINKEIIISILIIMVFVSIPVIFKII